MACTLLNGMGYSTNLFAKEDIARWSAKCQHAQSRRVRSAGAVRGGSAIDCAVQRPYTHTGSTRTKASSSTSLHRSHNANASSLDQEGHPSPCSPHAELSRVVARSAVVEIVEEPGFSRRSPWTGKNLSACQSCILLSSPPPPQSVFPGHSSDTDSTDAYMPPFLRPKTAHLMTEIRRAGGFGPRPPSGNRPRRTMSGQSLLEQGWAVDRSSVGCSVVGSSSSFIGPTTPYDLWGSVLITRPSVGSSLERPLMP